MSTLPSKSRLAVVSASIRRPLFLVEICTFRLSSNFSSPSLKNMLVRVSALRDVLQCHSSLPASFAQESSIQQQIFEILKTQCAHILRVGKQGLSQAGEYKRPPHTGPFPNKLLSSFLISSSASSFLWGYFNFVIVSAGDGGYIVYTAIRQQRVSCSCTREKALAYR